MNSLFREIKELYRTEKIQNFERLPSDVAAKRKFAELFRKLNDHLEAAKIQGFKWTHLDYCIKNENNGDDQLISVEFDETTYLILVKRYKELSGAGGVGGEPDVPYDLSGYITTIDTGKIDFDYMNSRFEKYTKLLMATGIGAEELHIAEEELHKTFASLSQEEQKYANIFLHDIQSGDVVVTEGKSFMDYVTEYASNAKNDQIHKLATALGLDESLLRDMMTKHLCENNINEFGRFDALKSTVNVELAKSYFENKSGMKLPRPKVNIKIDNTLRDFILKGGGDF